MIMKLLLLMGLIGHILQGIAFSEENFVLKFWASCCKNSPWNCGKLHPREQLSQ